MLGIYSKLAIKALACNFIKKETLTQVFSCEFYEISKSTFFTEHLWATASDCFGVSIITFEQAGWVKVNIITIDEYVEGVQSHHEWNWMLLTAQPTFTCSNSTIEKLGKRVKYQNNKNIRTISFTSLWCFYYLIKFERGLWANKC